MFTVCIYFWFTGKSESRLSGKYVSNNVTLIFYWSAHLPAVAYELKARGCGSTRKYTTSEHDIIAPEIAVWCTQFSSCVYNYSHVANNAYRSQVSLTHSSLLTLYMFGTVMSTESARQSLKKTHLKSCNINLSFSKPLYINILTVASGHA